MSYIDELRALVADRRSKRHEVDDLEKRYRAVIRNWDGTGRIPVFTVCGLTQSESYTIKKELKSRGYHVGSWTDNEWYLPYWHVEFCLDTFIGEDLEKTSCGD